MNSSSSGKSYNNKIKTVFSSRCKLLVKVQAHTISHAEQDRQGDRYRYKSLKDTRYLHYNPFGNH